MTGSVLAIYRTSIFAQPIKKPEQSPIKAANVNKAVPGLRIIVTPTNPIIIVNCTS